MTYYLLDTAMEKGANGEIVKTQAVYAHDNLNAAIIAFHDTMSYKRKVDTVLSALAIVINENGGIEKSEKFVREVPTVESPTQEDAEE